MKDLNKKYIIIAEPRTGSTILVRALARHPEVDSHPEILLHQVGDKYEERTEEGKIAIIKKFMEKEGVAGFKAMLVQMPFWGYDFIAEHQIKVIYLVLDDLVRQTISTEIANITDIWFDKVHQEKYELDPERIVELLKGLKRMREWFEAEHLPRYNNVLKLKYTDLVGEEGAEIRQLPEATATKINNFLGVSDIPLTVSMPKQGKKDLSEIVSNWEEVEKAINGLSMR